MGGSPDKNAVTEDNTRRKSCSKSALIMKNTCKCSRIRSERIGRLLQPVPEFGRALDDYHASRVLPGLCAGQQGKMLLQMKDSAEIVIVISAASKEQAPRQCGTSAMRMSPPHRCGFRGMRRNEQRLHHPLPCQPAADAFQKRLETLGVRSTHRHYIIPRLSLNVPLSSS